MKSASQSQTSTTASAIDINVLIVVDTDTIKAANPTPSQDPANPTAIGHDTQYMICADSRGIVGGQATGDLNFLANPGDFISFTGQSIYANSDDAVIVYSIVPFPNSSNVLGGFTVDTVQRSGAVFPNTTTSSQGATAGLPPVKMTGNFITLDARVSQAGTENYSVYFGLYTLDAGGQNQNLYGYFSWDPTITVAAPAAS
ncbi:MAG TPA: inclusion body family protein [Thermoanaerobaculia bacterium]